jgi:hypothetical protein
VSEGAGASPLFFERYEVKFQIPLSLVEPISRYVETFCDLDPYSARSLDAGGDGFYPITNLYLDSPRHHFLEKKLAGLNDTVSLRVRSYGDQGKFPYYLEVKHNHSGIKKKFRSRVQEDQWPGILDGSLLVESTDQERENRDLFLRLHYTYACEPKILTQYRRRAYASRINEYARVTFDKDLRYLPREHYDLRPDAEKMICYDDESVFDPGCSVILELKSTVQVPLWFLDLIGHFKLEESGFSKYGSGVSEVINLSYVPNLTRQTSLQSFQPPGGR